MSKIIVTADSTCDLGEELKARYEITYYPLHVILNGKQYNDGVDITPDEIYENYYANHTLPSTAAVNVDEYLAFFKQYTDAGYQVIHVNLGSGLSSCYQNARLAAGELEGVYVIDGQNLSSGMGLVVIEVAKRVQAGMEAEQIVAEVEALRTKCHASFILENLEFLHKGGRCSAVAVMGANLLKLKPQILVDNTSGKMDAAKKYRGSFSKALAEYVADELKDRTDVETDRIFITHSGMTDPSILEQAVALVKQYQNPDEICVTRASCTISSHCGPNTIGVLYRTK
ncbi:MAG: DegV family protein [Clostridia bacterium]|nr:DegV family protein [Clostridia bacterium]